MAESLQHKLEAEGEVLSLTSLCHFIWANTEMNINLGWTRSVLKYMLTRRYGVVASGSSSNEPEGFLTLEERHTFCETRGLGRYRGGELLPDLVGEETQQSQETLKKYDQRTTAMAESLLRAAFVCVSLGEEEYLMPLIEEVATAPSEKLTGWLSLVLGAPRYDVYYKGAAGNKFGPGSARLRVKDYNFDAWLSESLIQMKIPHKVTFVVGGVYRVSVAFPLEKHLVDVLTFQDLLSPSSQPTATAELRQRQLTFLVLDCNLRSFVAQIAAACCPQAAEHISFRSPKQQPQHTNQESGNSGVGVPVSALLGEQSLEKLPSLQNGNFQALELTDDDTRATSPPRRQKPPRQKLAVDGTSQEPPSDKQSSGCASQQNSGFEGLAEREEQNEALDADAREAIAAAEALQAVYGYSGGH